MNVLKRSMQERWEEAHEMPRFRPAYPHEQVVRWAFRNFDRNGSSKPKVLDLGCGAGRHAIFLAGEGFEVYACDISAVGLRELQASAAHRGLVVQTKHTAGHDLSAYRDGTFDAVLCFGVMYYLSLTEAKRMIAEVFRVLRAGGKFLCVTRSDGDSRCVQASPVGPCTWHINALGPGAPSSVEEGMDMLFFTEAELEDMFSSFDRCIDRMIYIHDGFTDDDWVVIASKP